MGSLLVVCPLVLFLSSTDARAGSGLEAVNLALNKPYEISPPPNYKLCTDVGDRFQLTDGEASGANWRRESTVGWRHAATPPTVRIDLGEVRAIDEVRIHTVGGGHAGVYFPEQILVLVSDDGKIYHVVRAWDRPGDDDGNQRSVHAIPRVFKITDLRTRGRYVQVTLMPNRRYAFLDEVEVIGGGHAAKEVSFDRLNRFGRDDAAIISAAMRRSERVLTDIVQLAKAAQNPDISDKKGKPCPFAADVKALARDADEAPQFVPSVWDGFASKLQSLRGRWLDWRFDRRLWWHEANAMSQVRPGDVFHAPESSAEVHVDLWQGEYESAAVNLVNASPDDVTLRVAVSPLRSPGGADLPWEKTITLRRAVFVESRRDGVVGDALARIVDGRLPITAGSAGQLWLTVHNPDLRAGEYHFVIRAARESSVGTTDACMVPARITVHPRRLPERVALKTYNWAYLSLLQMPAKDMAQVVDDLEAHYLDVYVVPAGDRPKTAISANGSLKVDFRRHDAALGEFPGAAEYLFFWAYAPDRLGDHARWGGWMSPDYKARMKEYLSTWVGHLRELGIGYDRFAMYPFDERLDESVLELARLIKEIDPNIRIFANSAGDGSAAVLARFTPYVDIWCLPGQSPDAEVARGVLRGVGEKDIRRYTAEGDAKSLSPYDYYRLQPWRAWAAGDVGCGFWTYVTRKEAGDCSGWDDFTCARGRWSVVYDGEEAPVDAGGEIFLPSRRWEAWRQGVEDYEYLHTLRERIERCQGRRVPQSIVAESEALLKEVVAEVLAKADNPDVVYQARRRLTEAILRLDKLLRGEDAGRARPECGAASGMTAGKEED